MANIGWVGLGRLGLPCALTFADHGHSVVGYDISSMPNEILSGQRPLPYESDIGDLIVRSTSFNLSDTIDAVVASSDVVFVAVQTPHAPAYGGECPMPEERRDFEYGFLTQAVRDVAGSAVRQRKPVTVVVVSTALPGTFNRYLRVFQSHYVSLLYNPFFIAMGTTISDLKNPEFVLIGSDNADNIHVEKLRQIYRSIHTAPFFVTSIESAELIKVAYNTFISMKIVFGNSIMEIAQKTGADCDHVIEALSLATNRIISSSYMYGGMGDGGNCHPRDLIAMSWLAQRLDLSIDLMGFIARAREAQTAWLAGLVKQWSELTGLNVVLLGKSYKPHSDLIGGSPALLLLDELNRVNVPVTMYDPYTEDLCSISGKAVYFISTKHDDFLKLSFEPGSVVLDPFGFISDQPGVTTICIGRKS